MKGKTGAKPTKTKIIMCFRKKKMTQIEASRYLGIGVKRLRNLMEEYGIKPRSLSEARKFAKKRKAKK